MPHGLSRLTLGREIAEDVGLAMLVTYAGYLAVKAGQLCYEAIRSR